MKYSCFGFLGAILNFEVKESPVKGGWTVQRLTFENMGIAFGMLSLGRI